METKSNQTVLIKKKDNAKLKMGVSIKRPKSYFNKKDKDLRTSVNKNEFEVRNKNRQEREGNLRKERKAKTKKDPELNNTENELNEIIDNKKKLLDEFFESCIKVMLSNHMARKR